MKITIEKLIQSVPSLRALATCKIEIETAYKIATRIRILDCEIIIIQKLFAEKTAELDEGAKKEEEQRFMKTEIEFEIEPLLLSDLAGISIEANHMMNLDFLICEQKN